MTQPLPPARSRTDRYGQLALAAIVCGLLGDAVLLGLGHARLNVWFVPLVVVTCIFWLIVIIAGIVASLDKTPRGAR